MIKKLHKTNDILNINYVVYYPDNLDINNNTLPLLVYLHGAGERGNNFNHIYRHAIPRLIKSGNEYNAVVLCPQCPAKYVWTNIVDKIKSIIDICVKEYNVLNDRICITGSSMGGFGTWSMGLTYPNFFSSIAPVAGGEMSWRALNLKSTPVYAVHGNKDNVVPYIYSRLMTDSVNAAGGNAELKILDGYGHNDGIEFAYEKTDIINWLLKQRRTVFDYVPETMEELF